MTKNIIILAVAAMVLASCVYPFTPELESEEIQRLVVDGDILLGEPSEFTISRVIPFGSTGSQSNVPDAEVWVSDSEGVIYKSPARGDRHTVDMTGAPEDREYSLHVKVDGKEYASVPSSASGTCAIDDIRYSHDKTTMTFVIDYSAGDCSHYRISFDEEWEYHARHYASVKYLQDKNELVPMPAQERNYYCWNSSRSSTMVLSSTEGLSTGSIKDFPFHTIRNNDRKVSYVYSMTVHLEPLSDEGYEYLSNIARISDVTGNLFTPTPSEMPGNIICITDPEDYATGYVNVTVRQSRRIFVFDRKTHFYKESAYDDDGFEIVSSQFWSQKYKLGLRPIGGDEQNGYGWAYLRCLDCTYEGGHTNRPEGWPEEQQ